MAHLRLKKRYKVVRSDDRYFQVGVGFQINPIERLKTMGIRAIECPTGKIWHTGHNRYVANVRTK